MRTWDKSKPPTGPFALNRDAPQAENLVAWYPLGGAGKLWVPDYVGPNHLTLGTDPGLTVGQAGAPVLPLVAASSQYLEGVIAGASALPLTLAGWCNTTSTGSLGVPICVGTNGGNARLQIQKDTSARQIGAAVVSSANAGNTISFTTSSLYTDNVDFHAAAVYTSSTSRQAFLNGVGSSVDTMAITASGMDRVLLGGRRNSTSVGAFWGGHIGEWGVWAQADDAAMIALRADPGSRFELWYPLRNKRWISIPAGNPTLTGQAVAAAVGALIPEMSAILSGNAAVTDQGSVSAAVSLALTGLATSAEQGTVAPVVTVALTGLGTTVDQGTLTVSGSPDITLALTGQATAVAQGALLASASVSVSGQSADVAQGSVLPQLDAALAGQAVALAQGDALPVIVVPVTGQGVSVGQGAMVAPGDLTVALMGVGVTVGQGALTASITPDPGNGKSGVNRMWLIEYYTKEFAKKAPIAVPEEIVGVAAKRNALNRAKAVRAKQIEALAAKAESDLEVLAQGVEDVRAAQQFTYNLIHQAQRQPEPEIDFMRVADSYRKRMKQEDDDLMLFAMVI